MSVRRVSSSVLRGSTLTSRFCPLTRSVTFTGPGPCVRIADAFASWARAGTSWNSAPAAAAIPAVRKNVRRVTPPRRSRALLSLIRVPRAAIRLAGRAMRRDHQRPTSGTLETDMTFRTALALTALPVLAACAGPQKSEEKGPDPLATLKFADGAPKPPEAPPAAANAYLVEISLERSDATRFAAPRLVASMGQVANISVGEDVPYVADVAKSDWTESGHGEPVKRTIHDGLSVDVCAQR